MPDRGSEHGAMDRTFFKTCYRWNDPPAAPTPGYSLFMPVPGDLPVFLKMALDLCSRQDPDHLVETLIIPDRATPALDDLIATWANSYSISPLRVVSLRPHDRLFIESLNHPQINYWIQLIRAGMAATATHAVLHDADLFMTDTRLLKTHYETCVERGLACLGVSPVWDRWFREHGAPHIVATWEMIFELAWLRSFAPWEHMGHEDTLDGLPHVFDVTLWPQSRTPPQKIGRHATEVGFVHFNYVIGTYRLFQRSRSRFEDQHFRLLLIRLLIDAYDPSSWPYDVPSLEALASGLTDDDARVGYRQASTRKAYPGFRAKLQRLVESGIPSDDQASILLAGIAPFDRALR
jgi:hypothetical protein